MSIWEWKEMDYSLRHYYQRTLPSTERPGIVLLSHVLAHSVNAGYHQLHQAIVERINGSPIMQMADVPRAFATPSGKFHVIEIDNLGFRADDVDPLAHGSLVVIDAAEAEAANAEILERHGIHRDRSADLA